MVTQVSTAIESSLVLVQAFVSQETERANRAEAQVGRLEQEVQGRHIEGREWYQELQQAQQDLLAAQVLLTHQAAVPIPIFVFLTCHTATQAQQPYEIRYGVVSNQTSCQLACLVMQCSGSSTALGIVEPNFSRFKILCVILQQL